MSQRKPWDFSLLCGTLCPLCLRFSTARTARSRAPRRPRASPLAEPVAAPHRCLRLRVRGRHLGRLPRPRGRFFPRRAALRFHPVRHLRPRFQLLADWPALQRHLPGSRSSMAEHSRQLILVRFAASQPGPRSPRYRPSRARAPAPHASHYLPPPSPAARQDDLASLLLDLYLSSLPVPAAVGTSARAADRGACADTPAPAALRGERPAPTLARPGAIPPPNPESPQPRSADCSAGRIRRTTQYISSSNTLRSPDRPSAPSPSSPPTYSLPESPCVPCPRSPPSASSTASRQ